MRLELLQRHLGELLGHEQRTADGVFRIEKRSSRGHLQSFGYSAHFQLNVDARSLAGMQSNPAPDICLESRGLDTQLIGAGGQKRDIITALIFGLAAGDKRGFGVGNDDDGARDRQAASVGDDADQSGRPRILRRRDRTLDREHCRE